jgi:hypothetical protein
MWMPAWYMRTRSDKLNALTQSETLFFLDLSIVRYFVEHKKIATFRKLDLFLYLDERREKTNPSHWRLCLSDGPNIVDVSHPSPEDGNRSRFRNVAIFLCSLEYQTMDRVEKSSKKTKKKVVSVFNKLSTTAWRHIRESMYRFTFSWPLQ